MDLHDRPQTHPDAGPQQRLYEQGSVCKLQITKRIRNAQLPLHERDQQTDAVRGRHSHLTTYPGCLSVQLFHRLVLYRHEGPYAGKYPAGE